MWNFGALILCFTLLASAKVFKLNLEKHDGAGEELLKQGRLSEYFSLQKQSRINRFNNNNQTLYEYSDVYYTTQIRVGTPGQVFTLIVDPEITDLWLPDSSNKVQNKDCKEHDGWICYNKTLFDSSKSSTYKADGRTFYDYQNKSAGFLGSDTVTLSNNLIVSGVTFGQVDTLTQYDYYAPYDGVLGLGLVSPTNPGLQNAFQVAIQEQVVDQPIYTLWLNRTGNEQTNGGQITWGGVDEEHCSSDITYLELVSGKDWLFSADSAQIGKIKRFGNWSAKIDHASALLMVPHDVYQDIYDYTGARYSPVRGVDHVDCSVKFQWTFTASGHEFTIDETIGVFNYDGYCALAFSESAPYEGADFLLGVPFSQNYCLIYDYSKRFGLSLEIK